MKRVLVASLLAAVVPVLGTGYAATTYTGSIAAPAPASRNVGGVTEVVGACDTAHPSQGLDGRWFDITGKGGQAAVLRPTGSTAAANDLDLWFYDAACDYISYNAMSRGSVGANETGAVPANAKYMIVDLFAGASAGFEVTIG